MTCHLQGALPQRVQGLRFWIVKASASSKPSVYVASSCTDEIYHNRNTSLRRQPMTIQVLIKNNYGNQVVYPTCEVGETFALIAGTKTLTDETRALMKRLGYQFEAKAVEL